jgi:nitrous oxide reductase
MGPKKTILSRRNFLLTAGAGGAAAVAAVVGKNASEPTQATTDDKRATSGYKVSAHIENYYRTTKEI